jgi:hypothetical protein
MVGCARCTARWAPVPPEAEPESDPERPRLEERVTPPEPALPMPEPAPLVAPAPEDRLAAPMPEPQRAGRALTAAWVASFLVLGVAAFAAYDRRDDVMRAWPASERAYAALGMGPRR